MSNTTSQEKPTFVGKYFDNTASFLEYFGFPNTETASKSMINLCISTGPSRGVQSDLYLQNLLDNPKLVMIMIIHDYTNTIKGFVVLKELDNTTVELSLICSKVKGGGTYLLNQVTDVFKDKFPKYKQIQLSAVKGVGQVYNKIAGYHYVEIDPDNNTTMTLDLEELRNKTIDEGNEEGKIVTRYGRKIKQTGVKPIKRVLQSSLKNVKEGLMSGVNTQGGKGKKTRKNGFKKRKQTRRRR